MMYRGLGRILTPVLAAVATSVSVAHAQTGMGESFPLARVPAEIRAVKPTPAVSAARLDVPAPEVRRLPAFVVRSSSAGEIAVTRVPLPADLMSRDAAGGEGITYRVTAGNGARVVSAPTGVLAPGESTLRLTLSLKRTAVAGRNQAATVEFIDRVGNAYVVPVEYDVAAQQKLQLLLPDAFIGAARGTWTAVRYSVRNEGNTTESVSLGMVLPSGWRSVADDARATLSLAPSASYDGMFRLWVPPQFADGQSTVRVMLSSGGAVVATATMQVDVRESQGVASARPQLTLTAVGATAADRTVATGYIVRVDGDITDSVRVGARFSTADVTQGAASYGVARGGVGNGPPSLQVRSPHLDASVGALGVQQSELAGFFVNGIGADGTVKLGAWSVGGFAARPFAFASTPDLFGGAGRFAGGAVAYRGDWGTAQLNGVSLRDAGVGRSLDAVSLSSSMTRVVGGQLQTEVGYRNTSVGSGAAVASTYRRRMHGSTIDLRAMHAPGGTTAFARARSDLGATVSQSLGELAQLSASAWRQGDVSPTFGSLQSTGWSVGPMINLRPLNSAVGIEARGASFVSATSTATFGTQDAQLSGFVDAHYRNAFASARLGYGRVLRSVDIDGMAAPDATGRQLETRVLTGVAGALGRVEASYVSQQYTGAPGLFPQQQVLQARVSQVRVPFLPTVPLFVDAEAQRFLSGAFGGANWMARGGVLATLPGTLGSVLFNAEYNPFIIASGGAGRGMLYSLRLERAFALPRFAPARDQRLFADANGDGLHQRNERGVSGIVIDCGSITVVTDAEGRFACPAGSSIRVDARTVPIGLLAPAMRGAATPRGDIALRPVQTRLVRLVVSGIDSARVKPSELGQAVVIARDTAGIAWVARSRGNGEFAFDALPPGRYEIEVDASAVPEPLRSATTPLMIVRDGESGAVIVIEMKTRDVRVKQLGTRQPNGAPQTMGRTDGGTRTNQRTQQ